VQQQNQLTAIIVVGAIIPPSGKMLSHKIVSVDGAEFFIFRERVHLLRVGEKYELTYYPKVADDGAIYNNIKMVRHLGPPRSSAATVTYDADASMAANPSLATVTPLPGRALPAAVPVPNYRAPTHPIDAERMFVCAGFGDFVRTGRVGDQIDDMVTLVNKLRATWRATFAAES
jgi:hypothetical protein